MGAAAAKQDGRATVAKMKSMPTDDDCFGPGTIREDGRALHPVYLMQVKSPAESTSEWDLLKVVATIAGRRSLAPVERRRLPVHQGLTPAG